MDKKKKKKFLCRLHHHQDHKNPYPVSDPVAKIFKIKEITTNDTDIKVRNNNLKLVHRVQLPSIRDGKTW